MPEISTIEELHMQLHHLRQEQMELWVSTPGCQSLCALISGEVGWLMYLRQEGDAGFSTRNPSFTGLSDAVIEYRLDNGQVDSYPASWALPLPEIQAAIEHFIRKSEPPPWLVWNNDSRDGTEIGQRSQAGTK